MVWCHSGRSELFKMTVRDTTNGFKALVRKGTLGQEVFISTTKMNLEEVKVISMPKYRENAFRTKSLSVNGKT